MIVPMLTPNMFINDEHSKTSGSQHADTSAPMSHPNHSPHENQFGFPDYHSPNNPHYQNFDPNMPNGTVIGNPAYDMKFWHHQFYNDCDIVSQQMGLESLTRKHFSESALLHEAVHDKTHFNGGTSAEYIGHLYEKHGFPIERHPDATLQELTQKLDDGQKIVAAVNSDLLWNTGVHNSHTLAANHSVEVIGVLYPDNGTSPMVILNDPGIDNGRGIMIPLEQFEHAWATSNHLIASAHAPDPHASLLRDQDPSQIIGSAGLGDGNRYIYQNDSQDVIDAKKWANQVDQTREQQRAAEEESQRERARIVAEEQAREARIREEQQRQEELKRQEIQREQIKQEQERQQREQERRDQQIKEEQQRAEQQKQQQKQEEERQKRNN